MIPLYSKKDQERCVSGDIKITFETPLGIGKKCKFYCWLNIGTIMYNEDLKAITAKRNEKLGFNPVEEYDQSELVLSEKRKNNPLLLS